jgi:hypothetical protein
MSIQATGESVLLAASKGAPRRADLLAAYFGKPRHRPRPARPEPLEYGILGVNESIAPFAGMTERGSHR